MQDLEDKVKLERMRDVVNKITPMSGTVIKGVNTVPLMLLFYPRTLTLCGWLFECWSRTFLRVVFG